jgi:hypothetical protein
MSIETTITGVIGPMVGGRCYPDFAPQGTALPYVTYQQVGGSAVNPIAGTAVNLRNARIQVNAWHRSRVEANDLMRSIEEALRPSPTQARPIGALMARTDDTTQTRGAQQDFDFWYG